MKRILVISGPSGSGKSTLLERFLQGEIGQKYFVRIPSVTTRPPRTQGDADDLKRDRRNYRFVTRRQFKKLIAREVFAEWAEIHGHLYGKLHEHITAILEKRLAAMELDVQGLKNLLQVFPGQILSVFMEASVEELVARLNKRGNTNDIERRRTTALFELQNATDYDYRIQSVTQQKSLEILTEIVKREMLDHV